MLSTLAAPSASFLAPSVRPRSAVRAGGAIRLFRRAAIRATRNGREPAPEERYNIHSDQSGCKVMAVLI